MRGAVEPVAVARDVASSSPSKAASALDMMRYQRVSSDCLPLPNGSGSSSGASRKPVDAAPRSSKDDAAAASAVAADTSRLATFLATTTLEPKPRARTPQPLPLPPQPRPAPVPPHSPAAVAAKSAAVARDHGHHRRSDFPDPTSESSIGGDASGSAGPDAAVLPKWGQTKRSRARRDSPTPASTPSPQRRAPVIKIARRASTPAVKLPAPPPPPRACTLRASSSLQPRAVAAAGDAHHRSTEERVAGGAGGQPRAPEKQLHNKGEGASVAAAKQKQQQKGSGGMEASSSKPPAAAAKRPEMPRILTALTRKEKEEDFLAMKGTKLPQRPKKRPKAVEKAVNLITPGMWLSEVTRSKYVVREKKSRKQQLQQQKYRGLKGMETLDSDSD